MMLLDHYASTNDYVKKFESNLTMSCKISDKELLKKYDKIWKKKWKTTENKIW